MIQKSIKIIGAVLIISLLLFVVDVIIRNDSYYSVRRKSFIWVWLFSTNETLREFPVVQPESKVLYNFRGYESNTLGMQEFQIEYYTKNDYEQILDTSIKYLEKKGYLFEQTNGVDCTWEKPTCANQTTDYYKDVTKKKHECLTFVITQVDSNTTHVKLYFMR